jgi:hypothetical protein
MEGAVGDPSIYTIAEGEYNPYRIPRGCFYGCRIKRSVRRRGLKPSTDELIREMNGGGNGMRKQIAPSNR